MERRVVTLPDDCGRCGARVDAYHVHSCREGRLRYSCSVRCAACGWAAEADGDEAPDDVRRVLLDSFGEWSVVVTALGERGHEVVRMIQGVAGGSLTDAFRLAKTGTPFGAGTLVEMRCLAEALTRAGATVTAVA